MGNTREGTARREIGNALCPEEIRRSLLDPCKDLVPPTAFASQDGLLLFPSIFFGWEISCPGGFLRETGNSGRNPGLERCGSETGNSGRFPNDSRAGCIGCPRSWIRAEYGRFLSVCAMS